MIALTRHTSAEAEARTGQRRWRFAIVSDETSGPYMSRPRNSTLTIEWIDGDEAGGRVELSDAAVEVLRELLNP